MSTVDNTTTETKAPAAAPETTHHHGGIIGKVEDVFHSAYSTFPYCPPLFVFTPNRYFPEAARQT